MITAVCLNPSIDRTISVDAFTYGGMNRVRACRDDAGGKGVNVAMTAARMGLDATLVGFLWRENGRIIEEKLASLGVSGEFVRLEGRMRTNLKLLDESKGVITEINERGGEIPPEALAEMTRMILAHAEKSDFLVLTGSTPPGVPEDYYRTLTEAAERLGCQVALDAEGRRLALGLTARPFLVKPNRFELATLTGRALNSLSDVRAAAQTLIDQGVSLVAVSLGGEGALMTNGREAYFAPALQVPVRSTVGAGDAMVAALAGGVGEGLSLRELLRRAVACAAASVMSEGTQPADPAQYQALLDCVEIRALA